MVGGIDGKGEEMRGRGVCVRANPYNVMDSLLRNG